MSIRPIDIVKTQEATQIKQVENQRIQHAQDQIGKNFQVQIQKEQQKPNSMAKADNHEYRYDAKEQGNNLFYKQNDKKKDKKEENKESKPPKKNGRGIDILI